MAKQQDRQMGLVLENGDEIALTIRNTSEEAMIEIVDDLRHAMATGGVWWVGNWLDVTAEYRGQVLENINTRCIVGYS